MHACMYFHESQVSRSSNLTTDWQTWRCRKDHRHTNTHIHMNTHTNRRTHIMSVLRRNLVSWHDAMRPHPHESESLALRVLFSPARKYVQLKLRKPEGIQSKQSGASLKCIPNFRNPKSWRYPSDFLPRKRKYHTWYNFCDCRRYYLLHCSSTTRKVSCEALRWSDDFICSTDVYIVLLCLRVFGGA